MALMVTDAGGDEWTRPIDLEVDSFAPAQIAADLAARHGLYLREAQRLLAESLVPDGDGLAAGIRAETHRYLRSHPWLDTPALAEAVGRAEATALGALRALVDSAPVIEQSPTPPAPAPTKQVRRISLQPSATIVGNMAVRKAPIEGRLELAWDGNTSVATWTVRVSVRPDPRRDYVEGELVTLAPGSTVFTVELDDEPRRIQIYGHARDGRLVRRAAISALTAGNSRSQWKRQATSS